MTRYLSIKEICAAAEAKRAARAYKPVTLRPAIPQAELEARGLSPTRVCPGCNTVIAACTDQCPECDRRFR